jgi:DNA mismatch repair protein MutS2
MNEHTLKVLEFDKVTSILASYAASDAGRAAVIDLHPSSDRETVGLLLQETGEFTRVLQNGENPPLDGIRDLGSVLTKLGASGTVLTPVELMDAAVTLNAARKTKTFFQRFEGKGPASRPSVPMLCALASRIQPLKPVEEAIRAAIDDAAEVRDTASADLRKIRKRLTQIRDEILDRLSRMLQDGGSQRVIQEPVITIRDDRYVLPLKPNFRQSLKGVVHGHSGSRATLFVEPLDVLEQNNRLAELRMEEREEIERILRGLTALLSREVRGIEETVRALAKIDAIYARARFGIAYDCIIPKLSPGRAIRLRQSRHPLLVDKAKSAAGRAAVTPNTVELDGEQRALILSGPNAGGKTVILKTIGLLCLMAQAGIPVTASEGSELPCFGTIFADIGDEQSLDQDLSTFSSHVAQIARILGQADADSLVLLDELGSGTDPGEGAALGAAVLESLIERNCLSVITTHQNALKLFGSHTSGAINAAMEIDLQTLTPTYRLISGRPGRSYGLDMAARLGISSEIIGKARARLDADEVRLDQLLRQVEEDAGRMAVERQALDLALDRANTAQRDAEAVLRAAREEAREVKVRANTDAREILSALRQKLRELSRTAALEQAAARKASAEIETLRGRLEPDGFEGSTVTPASLAGVKNGDTVRIISLNKTGTVLGSKRGMLELEVDGKKIKVAAAEVVPSESPAQHRPAFPVKAWGTELSGHEGAPDRLNIIGCRVQEGLAEVDRFIDRAGLNQGATVTVIHGLGTGALKTAVTDFLKNHPLVASIRPGEPCEGGAGVTVAELKK